MALALPDIFNFSSSLMHIYSSSFSITEQHFFILENYVGDRRWKGSWNSMQQDQQIPLKIHSEKFIFMNENKISFEYDFYFFSFYISNKTRIL